VFHIRKKNTMKKKQNLPYPKLREMRLMYSYKQEYIAEVLGISQPEYSRLENGLRSAKIDEFKKHAGIYKISPSMLMVSDSYAHIDFHQLKSDILEETAEILKQLTEENRLLRCDLNSSIQNSHNLLNTIYDLQYKGPYKDKKGKIAQKNTVGL